jgi:hypothetical protein
MTERTLVWRGTDAPRLELTRVRIVGTDLHASGAQIGVDPEPYELRYELSPGGLRVEIDGREVDLRLEGADFFDLESSPLFNALPIARHGLHRGGEPHEFVMQWVAVPTLEVSRSKQRYEPLAQGRIRFRSGDFSADLDLDDDGFVISYPGLAERVWPAA